MPPLPLPRFWTVLLDCTLWPVFQVGIAFVCVRIPRSWFDSRSWLFRTRNWEQGGAFYERWFRVRRWKYLLPDGGVCVGGDFAKRSVRSRDRSYLQTFVAETCRAELTHWLAMLPAAVFFLWNVWWVGLIMVLYAVLVNTPCIVAQRYNRVRLKRLLRVPE